jgi:hypothetical protein
MVMMFGKCEANTILVLLTRSMPLSPSMQAHLRMGIAKQLSQASNCYFIDVY